MNYLLYGQEQFLIDKEVKNIISKSNIEEINISKYDLEFNTIKEILEDANTISLFDNNKLIIVENAFIFSRTSSKKIDDIDLLEEYLKNSNQNTIIIFIDNQEKIDNVKDRASVKGADIVSFNTKLESYAKTITLIEGRINQMSTYLPTREKIAKSDEELAEFLAISGYRYETLKDTLDYIKSLWTMTKNYVSSAQKLFDGLGSQITEKSVDNLTIVTSMGVGASLIGLFTESAPSFTVFGVVYFFALALVGWLVNKIMSTISKKRKYEVADIEYDKDI